VRLPDDAPVTFLPMEAVWPGKRLDLSQRRDKAQVAIGYTRFQSGDVLVPKITPTFEAARSILTPKLATGVGAGTTELHVLRPGSRIDGRYLAYIVNSVPFLRLGEAEMYGVAGQKRVPDEFIRNFLIDLPELEEQRQIADFLDTETTRIDRVLSIRRQQADLLAESQLARILDALSGKSEGGPRKESGLRWLGAVPSLWSVAPVSAHFEVLLGKMLGPDRVLGNHLRPYLRNTNVQWDRIDISDLLYMNFPPAERVRYEVRPGDLLVCEGGDPGRAATWTGEIREIYYQKALHRIRRRSDSEPRWLFYCLRAASAMNAFAVEGNQTTIAHLTGEQLRAQRFPFPSPTRQRELIAHLDELEQCTRTLIAM